MDGLAARARWSPIGETETLPGHRILHGLPLRLRAVRAGDPVSPRPLPATPRRVRCHPADYCSSLLPTATTSLLCIDGEPEPGIHTTVARESERTSSTQAR